MATGSVGKGSGKKLKEITKKRSQLGLIETLYNVNAIKKHFLIYQGVE